jgi:hypothetical protein
MNWQIGKIIGKMRSIFSTSWRSVLHAICAGIGSILMTTGLAMVFFQLVFFAVDSIMGNPHHDANWGVGIVMLPFLAITWIAGVAVTIILGTRCFDDSFTRFVSIALGLSFWMAVLISPRIALKPMLFTFGGTTALTRISRPTVQALVGVVMLAWLRKHRSMPDVSSTLDPTTDPASHGSRG